MRRTDYRRPPPRRLIVSRNFIAGTRQNSQRRTPRPRGFQNPVAVKRERRNAGQAAAARAAVRPGRPADDADDGSTALAVLKHRPAGIPGAGAEPVAGALRERIDQTDL